jgi:hypothetical protein
MPGAFATVVRAVYALADIADGASSTSSAKAQTGKIVLVP